MTHHTQQTTKEIATIGVGAGIAGAGVNVAQNALAGSPNVLPQAVAELGVTNATRGALGILSSAIVPAAGLMVGLAGIKMMTRPLFEPWTSFPAQRRQG